MELELDLKTLLVALPVMPWREFADWIRMNEGHDVVEGWIKHSYLPTVKIGRHRMVNVAQLVQSLLNEEDEAPDHLNDAVTLNPLASFDTLSTPCTLKSKNP